MPKPRGKYYLETMGNIINYEELAHFIVDYIKAPQLISSFLDVPCGTGDLLNNLVKINNTITYFGLDNSEKQLEFAKEKNRTCSFFKSDIFKMDKVLNNNLRITDALCHIGFSFFNVLSPFKRVKLLNELLQIRQIRMLGFEIQNVEFQKSFFLNGVWYKTKLSNELEMNSRSEYLGKDYKKLDMHFIINNKTCKKCTEFLFDWPITNCISDCQNAGWKIRDKLPALYRESGDNISHWFILCER